MATVQILKADLFFPEVQSLKEKRARRLSLTQRLKAMNISVIEMKDPDILQRLILLLSYCALDGRGAMEKREKIVELFCEKTEHFSLEEESIDVD